LEQVDIPTRWCLGLRRGSTDHLYVFMSETFCMNLVCLSFSRTGFWIPPSQSPPHHVKCLGLWRSRQLDLGSSGHPHTLVS